MPAFDPTETVRQCVSCSRCYPSNLQFCRDCLIELTTVETIPYTINSRYQLEKVIGRGGTGVIFQATDLELGREVTVKVIRASVMVDPRSQDRFRLEVRIAIDFKHPLIAEVYDFGLLPDASGFVVSEFVKGNTLKSEMKNTGKYKLDPMLSIISAICDALDAAHKAGLVHRDLKPNSIILIPRPDQPRPNIKIVDFSFTRIATGRGFVPGTTAILQGQGHLPLKPTYLSPEQFQGQEADLRSDIYSLGVISFEMLGGQPPFSAKRMTDFGVKLLNTKPPSLRQLNSEVNIMLEAEILRALEKDPHNRHQRALEFKRELLNASHLS